MIGKFVYYSLFLFPPRRTMPCPGSGTCLLIDNSAQPLFNALSGNDDWGLFSSDAYLGGSMALSGPTIGRGLGNVTITFQGTSISFTGNTPSSNDSPGSFLVTIDSHKPYQATFPNFSLIQNHTQWYQSPLLSDSTQGHSITISQIATGLDYAIVSAGQATESLDQYQILVDDDDTEQIWYSGKGWETRTDVLELNGGFLDGPPVGNTTHQSNTVGDSFEFQFAGTEVEVYGVFLWTANGEVDIGFNLDNGSQMSSARLTVSNNAPLMDQQPYFRIFQGLNLSPGNHTLFANITSASGTQRLIFDYILYRPSFSRLADKPVFSPASSSSSSSSTTSDSTSPTQSTSESDAQNQQSNSGLQGGEIGGIVTGILVLLLLVGTGVWVLRRARRRRGPGQRIRSIHHGDGIDIGIPPTHTDAMESLAPTPLILPPPSSIQATGYGSEPGPGSGSGSRRNEKSSMGRGRSPTSTDLSSPSRPGPWRNQIQPNLPGHSTSETQVQINELRVRIEELTQSLAPVTSHGSQVESSPPPYAKVDHR
ncbi:hypothetical protein D9758_009405 [Tetrapyrgos nigripes]|uniref:Uncharacterized protein n=1 Tax=Tetrapyrgos nigripes TaxID=182062 RepID=A0A8H5FX20_9AGAR|nr:hypothetical protein D9758_009405 [Tetrapyrgos nigripes]